jgi:hypothetical protein
LREVEFAYIEIVFKPETVFIPDLLPHEGITPFLYSLIQSFHMLAEDEYYESRSYVIFAILLLNLG